MSLQEIVEATLKYSDSSDASTCLIAPRQSGVTTQAIKKINRYNAQGKKYFVCYKPIDIQKDHLDSNIKIVTFDRFFELVQNKEISKHDYVLIDNSFYIVSWKFETIINTLSYNKTPFTLVQTGLCENYNDYFVVMERNGIKPIIYSYNKIPEKFRVIGQEHKNEFILNIDNLYDDYRVHKLNVLTSYKAKDEYRKIIIDLELIQT